MGKSKSVFEYIKEAVITTTKAMFRMMPIKKNFSFSLFCSLCLSVKNLLRLNLY